VNAREGGGNNGTLGTMGQRFCIIVYSKSSFIDIFNEIFVDIFDELMIQKYLPISPLSMDGSYMWERYYWYNRYWSRGRCTRRIQ